MIRSRVLTRKPWAALAPGMRRKAPRRAFVTKVSERSAQYQLDGEDEGEGVDDFVVIEEPAAAEPLVDEAALPLVEPVPPNMDEEEEEEADEFAHIALPTYELNCLYLEKAVGIAVDQRLASGEKGPVTEYYWWPAKDAWNDLKAQLEGMPWIAEADVVDIMNKATSIINFWQGDEGRPTMEEARAEFPRVTFYGT
jgi:30S ribosomal protein 3